MWSRQRRKLGQRSRGGRKCRVGGTEGRAVAEAQSEGQGDEEGVDAMLKCYSIILTRTIGSHQNVFSSQRQM